MSVCLQGSVIAGFVFASGCIAPAGADWNQWGGADRNFAVVDPGLATQWPSSGPPVRWKRALGDGYSGMVTDGARIYTAYRPSAAPENKFEVIVALDRATGATVWEHRYEAPYINEGEERKQTTEFGSGPNATPLLANGRLYMVGFTGIMNCLDARTGRLLWKSDLYHDFKGTFLIVGYAASPIAYRDTVIVPVGGKGHGLVAFNQATGAVVWQGSDCECSFASPVLMTVGGQDHLVSYMAREVIGVDPRSGKQHWSVKHHNPMNDNCICTPVPCPGDRVYVANFGESGGGRMIQLTRAGDAVSAADIWLNKKITGGLSDAVLMGNQLYGAHTSKSFASFSAATGEIAWQSRDYQRCVTLRVGERLLLLSEQGDLMLCEPGSQGLKQLCKARLLEKESWTAPMILGKTAYLRDRKHIMAVDLG